MTFKSKILSPQGLVSGACLAFGAVQTLTLGLFPAVSRASETSLSSVIFIYGLGILLFLFFTKFWGQQIPRWGLKTTLFVGLFGLATSQIFMMGVLEKGGVWGIFPFVISRALYAMTASSIIPLSHALRLSGVKDNHESKLLDHSIALNGGRVFGFAIVFLLGLNLSASLTLISLISCGLLSALPFITTEERVLDLPGEGPGAFDSVYLLPILFCVIVSSFHTGLSKLVTELVSGGEAQTALLYQGLLGGTLLVTILQFGLRKMKGQLGINAFYFGISCLSLASIVFELVADITTYAIFVALLAVSASIVPVSYMKKIYERFARAGRAELAASINFYQVLGNSIGAILTGLLINLEFSLGWVTLAGVLALLVATNRVGASERFAS